jgi:hypothetical protein
LAAIFATYRIQRAAHPTRSERSLARKNKTDQLLAVEELRDWLDRERDFLETEST